MSEISDVTYYFCDLKSKDIECPKMHECKRYEPIKDVPYNQYESLGFAKLYNLCNENNIKLIRVRENGCPTLDNSSIDYHFEKTENFSNLKSR